MDEVPLSAKDFHFAFIGPKTAASSGCKLCVALVNKAIKIIQFLEQISLSSIEKCDASPSIYKKKIGNGISSFNKNGKKTFVIPSMYKSHSRRLKTFKIDK